MKFNRHYLVSFRYRGSNDFYGSGHESVRLKTKWGRITFEAIEEMESAIVSGLDYIDSIVIISITRIY